MCVWRGWDKTGWDGIDWCSAVKWEEGRMVEGERGWGLGIVNSVSGREGRGDWELGREGKMG